MPIKQINQFVSTVFVDSLLGSDPAPLSGWYAVPMALEQADRLCQAAQQAIQARLRAGASCFQQRLLALICCDVSPAVTRSRYNELVQTATNTRERALLELVYGQWLASRKLMPAMRHLEDGFRMASPLLASEDYFRLLRRHERLACLVFTAQASSAQDLPELLTEAAVTECLQGRVRRSTARNHQDTLG
ncbi:MAG: hypothetical protein OEU91_03080 [Gammaproteobacteria bacterium]|nr:hypothetical protein [Gammaproteobacteria bacterium]